MSADQLLTIDYVRIMHRGPIEHVEGWEQRMLEKLPTRCISPYAELKKHARFGTTFDGRTSGASRYFEVWGSAADVFFTNLEPRLYDHVTRIDVRSVVPTPPVDMEVLTHEVMNIGTNARRTVGYKISPARTKSEGRDVGGRSLTVGVKDSARRVSLYKRGKEPYALEVQFAKGRPLELFTFAKNAWEDNNRPGALGNYTRASLEQAYYDAIADMTGHTYGQFAHLEMWGNQDGIFSSQESMLTDLEDRWLKLDPESQAAFIAAQVYPNMVARPIDQMSEDFKTGIMPVQYSDQELEDMARLYGRQEPIDPSEYLPDPDA